MEGGLDTTSMLLVVLSILDPEVFSSYITNILLSRAGIGFLFKGIIKKLN